MMMEPLIGLQENTYVGGVPSDDLMWELDHCTEMVYTEHVKEQNREEMARYTNPGPESDYCRCSCSLLGPNTCLVVLSSFINVS